MKIWGYRIPRIGLLLVPTLFVGGILAFSYTNQNLKLDKGEVVVAQGDRGAKVEEVLDRNFEETMGASLTELVVEKETVKEVEQQAINKEYKVPPMEIEESPSQVKLLPSKMPTSTPSTPALSESIPKNQPQESMVDPVVGNTDKAATERGEDPLKTSDTLVPKETMEAEIASLQLQGTEVELSETLEREKAPSQNSDSQAVSPQTQKIETAPSQTVAGVSQEVLTESASPATVPKAPGTVAPVITEKEPLPTASRPNTSSEINHQADVELNKYVLKVIDTYKGNYPYLLNNDYTNYNGVSVNISYQNQLLLKAHPSGSKATHCVGITFEVFFKAMEMRNKALGLPINDFNGMTAEELWDFILMWYVASGPKAQNNCATAIEKYGLGKRINNLSEAKAGDFIDFSRENNTGHTAIFINWIKEDGKIVGLKYWSSQGSTNGIAFNEEYFNVRDSQGQKYGNVIIDELYIGRVMPVKDYQAK